MAKLIAVVFFAYAVLFGPDVLTDDTPTHVVVGQWILAHGRPLWTDPLTYTFGGRPWQAHEWLAALLFALAYRIGSWSGVLVLTAVAASVACVNLVRHLHRWIGLVPSVICVGLAFVGVGIGLFARPHILVLPLMELWVAALVTARAENRSPSLWLLPVMTLWANMHGGAIIGLVVAGFLGLEAILANRSLAVLRSWALFGLGSLLAAMATPFGWNTLLFPFRLTHLHGLATVSEWLPTNFVTWGGARAFLLVLVALLLSGRVRVSLPRTALIVILVSMGLSHTRHTEIWPVIIPLLLAPAMRTGFPKLPISEEPRIFRLAWVVALAALCVVRLAIPKHLTDFPSMPVSAIASVPAALREQPVLNSYRFGNILEFDGIKTYIDDRVEVFDNAFEDRWVAMGRGDKAILREELEHWHVRWALLEPGGELDKQMATLPNWTRSYADRFAVVYVRR